MKHGASVRSRASETYDNFPGQTADKDTDEAGDYVVPYVKSKGHSDLLDINCTIIK